MRNRTVVTAIVAAVALVVNSNAANKVTVESKQVTAGQTGVTLGVYIENDARITAITIPLEFREYDPGSYLASGAFSFLVNPAGRLDNSPLSATADPGGLWPGAQVVPNRKYSATADPNCVGGGPSKSYQTAVGTIDYVSPDAVFHAAVSTGDTTIGEQITLEPGSDFTAGEPSLILTFNVNNTQGRFVIDTCCVRPANHCEYIDVNNNLIVAAFQHGTVGIDVPAGIKDVETRTIPESYVLEQNYPNPFNAGTVIRFAQPVDGNVRIDVFNILGRKVKTLVNEFRVAGTHQTDWDGRSDDGIEVATGVYFYRITTEGFSSTRKMVLLK